MHISFSNLKKLALFNKQAHKGPKLGRLSIVLALLLPIVTTSPPVSARTIDESCSPPFTSPTHQSAVFCVNSYFNVPSGTWRVYATLYYLSAPGTNHGLPTYGLIGLERCHLDPGNCSYVSAVSTSTGARFTRAYLPDGQQYFYLNPPERLFQTQGGYYYYVGCGRVVDNYGSNLETCSGGITRLDP